VTLADLLRWSLAAVLVWAAAAKLAAGDEGRGALRSFGLRGPAVQAAGWAALIAAEAGLAVAVALRVPGAAEAAAALLAAFALALAVAIARGRGGAPCACFGSRSRIGWPGVVRSALLAAGFAVLPFLPDVGPSAQTWLAIGLAVALAAIGLLGVGLLALARELGELRLALGPQAALSLAGEGPELGSRTALIERFVSGRALALAVFSSPGCRLCQALEPSLRHVASDSRVELEVFDEEEDAAAWTELRVPGSPYGVVLDPQGVVLAKGSFNTLPQLEGLLAAAVRRDPEPLRA
jgi:hypothetical protein